YNYYFSSSDVSTGIPVKILLVELAPALGCFVSSETPSRVTSEARLVLLAGSASEGVLRDAVQCLRVWEGREVDSFPTTATLSEIEEEWVRQECFRFDKLR
ncbi:hypothetical protein PR002_g27637, partial [Phytophthora rubi]